MLFNSPYNALSQTQHVKLGRPRSTTPATGKAILIALKRNRFESNPTIASSFGLSKSTIRRRSIENKLPSRRAVRDPLQQQHKTSRRLWCLNHLHTDFRGWIFSDECNFEYVDCIDDVRRSRASVACCLLPSVTVFIWWYGDASPVMVKVFWHSLMDK